MGLSLAIHIVFALTTRSARSDSPREARGHVNTLKPHSSAGRDGRKWMNEVSRFFEIAQREAGKRREPRRGADFADPKEDMS